MPCAPEQQITQVGPNLREHLLEHVRRRYLSAAYDERGTVARMAVKQQRDAFHRSLDRPSCAVHSSDDLLLPVAALFGGV